jgi:hypothetical protein
MSLRRLGKRVKKLAKKGLEVAQGAVLSGDPMAYLAKRISDRIKKKVPGAGLIIGPRDPSDGPLVAGENEGAVSTTSGNTSWRLPGKGASTAKGGIASGK